MDAALGFENTITLHGKDIEHVTLYVRKKVYEEGYGDESLSFTLQACRSNLACGNLPFLSPSTVPPTSTGSTSMWTPPNECAGQIERAKRGSVALQVLEELYRDNRRDERAVTLTAFAELIDLDGSNVIDLHGCRWSVWDTVDVFRLSTSRWKRETEVTPPTDRTSCIAFHVASALRAVAAIVYAVFNAVPVDIEATENNQSFHPFHMAAIALCHIVCEASYAIVDLSVYIQDEGHENDELRPGSHGSTASLRLPCGTDLQVTIFQDEATNMLTHASLKPYSNSSNHSQLSIIVALTLVSVLHGAGIEASVEMDPEDVKVEIDEEFLRIVWTQAAVPSFVIKCGAEDQPISNARISELSRHLSLYRVGTWLKNLKTVENESGVDTDYEAEERLILAKEEAIDIMSEIDDWDQEMYLGGLESETGTNGSDNNNSRTEQPLREEFLHFGSGSSDLPILDQDKTVGELELCARRGVPIAPDGRRSVVIRKGRVVWGRVQFDGQFKYRPLASFQKVLRALVPVKTIGIGPVLVEQFEHDSSSPESGSELANLLLSGVLGAENALWALKKILYSDVIVKKTSLPEYLSPLHKLGRTSDEKYDLSIVSLLGTNAVQALEVIVDDEGQIVVDYEGVFNPIRLELKGRRLRCGEIDDYHGGQVGTITNKVCIF